MSYSKRSMIFTTCTILALLPSLIHSKKSVYPPPRITRQLNTTGSPLTFPNVTNSSKGTLKISLTIEYGNITGAAHSFIDTRLLNGTFPGPTIRLKAGDTLSIAFENRLSEQRETAVVTDLENHERGGNRLHSPDVSNLHFHGAHVPGELPSDDVRLRVEPGTTFQYKTTFPDNHMPGTHWIHPHVHGSSAMQVGGGAAMAMIVEDPPDYLPRQVEDAKEILLVVQHINLEKMREMIEQTKDEKLKIGPGADEAISQSDYRSVNGLFQPTLEVTTGEWQRWRIIYAGWREESLNLSFRDIDAQHCEMQLLAKDGIYIRDYPRRISQAPIPTGGRADVMVRCDAVGEYDFIDFGYETVLTVQVTGNVTNSTVLEPWTPEYPAYLTDLREDPPSPQDGDCTCVTKMHKCDFKDQDGYQPQCINAFPFDPLVYIHTVKFGSVIDRILINAHNHPYHQHVYPFQLVNGTDDNRRITQKQRTYFKQGDWHDVLKVKNLDVDPVVRYKPDVHTGRIMMHCHRLEHEDRGMMAQELVVVGKSAKCECDVYEVSKPVKGAKKFVSSGKMIYDYGEDEEKPSGNQNAIMGLSGSALFVTTILHRAVLVGFVYACL